MHGYMADIALINADYALICFDQADNHVKAGGFAGSVGAKQADDLTALDFKIYVFDDLADTVGFGQVCGCKDPHGCFFGVSLLEDVGWISMISLGCSLLTVPAG